MVLYCGTSALFVFCKCFHNCCACLVLFFVSNENSLKVRGLRLFEGQDFLTGFVKLLNINFHKFCEAGFLR